MEHVRLLEQDHGEVQELIASRHEDAIHRVVAHLRAEERTVYAPLSAARADDRGADVEGALDAIRRADAELEGAAEQAAEDGEDGWGALAAAWADHVAASSALHADADRDLPESSGQDLLELFFGVMQTSPLRPHPHLPHTGQLGEIADSITSAVDRRGQD